jgi:hypothetical protein
MNPRTRPIVPGDVTDLETKTGPAASAAGQIPPVRKVH